MAALLVQRKKRFIPVELTLYLPTPDKRKAISPITNLSRLGKKIKYFRLKKDLTRDELAKISGVSRGYLAVGALLGYSIGKEKSEWSPIKKPNTVTVDIVKEGDEILIYLSHCSEGALQNEHYSGELVFEYNKNKEVDKEAYREFEEGRRR